MSVYLALVYVNDSLNDILVFETLEKAIAYKQGKDSFNPCCEIVVSIEEHYIR